MTVPISSSLTSDLKAMPRAFWVLVLGTFINRFGSFVYPFLTIFLNRRGLSYAEIGAVIAGYGAGGLLASLWGGWFADRFGRRNTIVAGTLANAASIFAMYYAHEISVLVFLTLCAGVTGGFYQPAAGALVADLIPEDRRLPAYALMRQAANAGFAFGTAAGGFLVSHSTFWLFAGDAITTAAYGVIALIALPHGLRHGAKHTRWKGSLNFIRGDQRFWALYAAQFLCALIFSQFASSYALEVKDRHMYLFGLSPEQIFGVLIGWNGLMVMLVELPLTRVTQRFDAKRVMCLGYTMLGIGFAMNTLHFGFIGLFVSMTIFTLGETLALPMLSTWVAQLAPEPMRGRYIGAIGTSWSAAQMVGPAMGLQIYAYSPNLLWLGCAGLGAAAAAILYRFGSSGSEPKMAIPAKAVLEAVE